MTTIRPKMIHFIMLFNRLIEQHYINYDVAYTILTTLLKIITQFNISPHHQGFTISNGSDHYIYDNRCDEHDPGLMHITNKFKYVNVLHATVQYTVVTLTVDGRLQLYDYDCAKSCGQCNYTYWYTCSACCAGYQQRDNFCPNCGELLTFDDIDCEMCRTQTIASFNDNIHLDEQYVTNINYPYTIQLTDVI